MTRRKLIFVSILSVLVLGGAGGFYWLGNGTGKASFRTTPVERGDIQSSISATGTLNAVVALSGYVMAPDSNPVAFAMIVTGITGRHGEVRQRIDAVVRRIHAELWKAPPT